MSDEPRAEHVCVVRCGKSLRNEHHLPHTFTFQASDDSPEQVVADCPGWVVPYRDDEGRVRCRGCPPTQQVVGTPAGWFHVGVVHKQFRYDEEPMNVVVGPDRDGSR